MQKVLFYLCIPKTLVYQFEFMKFTFSWLKQHIETTASLGEITAALNTLGLEVESVTDISQTLKDFSVAQILEAKQHPNANSLKLCSVFDGNNTYEIVCGAANARSGIKVVLAKEGVVIPNSNMVIKKTKIRGVESCGMLCSLEELNLAKESEGIIQLPEDAIIGSKALDYLGASDPVIEIAITPNRGDCLSVRNIALDLAAKGLGEIKPLNINNINKKLKALVEAKSSIENTVLYVRTIKSVKNTQSPTWLKQRLEAIGIKPFSALVDISNYVCYTLGNPNHIYNASSISGDLEIKFASPQSFTALNDKVYNLNEQTLVIADEQKTLAIAGIIGGKESACPVPDEKEIDVVVEVAYFPAPLITKTGRDLNILTDSRYRFERNVNPSSLETALDYITNLVLDICGGEPSAVSFIDNLNFTQTEIEYDFNFTNKILGFEIATQKQREILTNLGFEISGNTLTVPSHRSDIKIKQDVVEEIARIYGYENLPEIKPNSFIKNPFSAKETLVNNLRSKMQNLGYSENLSFAFLDEITGTLFSQNLIRLTNPISEDLSVLRPSLIASLILNLNQNLKHGAKNIKFFEAGNIFSQSLASSNYQELCLAGIIYGNIEEESVYKQNRFVDVYDAKQLAEILISFVTKPENLKLESKAPSYFHPTRSGSYFMGKNLVASFGEIHPKITQKFKLKHPLVAFELFIDRLNVKEKKKTFTAFKANNLPEVERDFAIVVDEKIEIGKILEIIKKADSAKHIQDIIFFDIYKGQGIAEDKKSVAFKVILKPKEKTFLDEEIKEISNLYIKALENNIGAVLRA